jgi:peroxiredoxin (alkyl hydroperoxide reductase subunit C)
MEATVQPLSMPRIGEKAPAFKAVTTQGEINFPEQYSGPSHQWKINLQKRTAN